MISWFNSVRDDLATLGKPRVALTQLAATWRVWLVILIGEALGALIGLWLHLSADTLKNFWVGGVLGAVPGLGIGLWWELADAARRARSPRAIRLLYILSLLGLLLLGVVYLALWSLASNPRLERP